MERRPEVVRVLPNWALMTLEQEKREMPLQSNDGLRFLSVNKAEYRHIKGQRLGHPCPSKAALHTCP